VKPGRPRSRTPGRRSARRRSPSQVADLNRSAAAGAIERAAAHFGDLARLDTTVPKKRRIAARTVGACSA